MFDPLPSDLASGLAVASDSLGDFGRLRYCAEVDSTNDVVLSLAGAGERAGASVLADRQRAGRGRRGREWFSPAGDGLYLSVLTRPRVVAGTLPLMTIGAGVAVAGAVRAMTGLPVELKWPNDLVIGRPWRKLGGVLSEAAAPEGKEVTHPVRRAVVVGIGVNLRQGQYPKGVARRATSIEAELGKPVDRAPLVVAILRALRDTVDLLENDDSDRICDAWRVLARAGLAGAPVAWQDQGRARHGRARDIDRDGALLVEVDGQVERVMAGEVTWPRLSRE